MLEPGPLQQVDRTYVSYRGRKLAYFAGCDYFRLASHPEVLEAAKAGLNRYGLNVAASRLTTGNHKLYDQLEEALASFFGAADALLVSTGYAANLVVAQALAGNFSHALIDESAHPSLADAARFLDCPVLLFRHRDPQDLARAATRCGPQSSLMVLTDGMYSRDGSAAPLKDYFEVLPGDAVLLVDDSHGAGVLGRTGKGTPEHSGVGRSRLIQTVTLSKAFGAYGGAILGTASLRRRIFERSRLFVGGTPLPLPLANAALRGVELLKTDKTFRRRLARNSARVKTALRRAGLALPDNPGPIVPLLRLRKHVTGKLKRDLLAAGIYPPFIHYPGGPASGYFRFVISSEHTPEQLERLVEVLSGFPELA